MMTFGSLFAGIGGVDLGLERAGMECKWQVEVDEYATRVLAKHWPHVRRWDDIKTFPPDTECDPIRDEPGGRNGEGRTDSSITEHNGELWDVDLICGGFPCQDISYAGRGAGLEGERSGLFFDAIRVVRQLRPRYVLLENVAALLTRGLDRVHGELATLGYDSESHCIPAAAVGAPHIRDRVFVLGRYSAGDVRRPAIGEIPFRDTVVRRNGILRKTIRRSEQWQTEPDVGRVANGIPRTLDIGGLIGYIRVHGQKNQIDVAEESTTQGKDGAMRILRLYVKLATAPSQLEYARGRQCTVSEMSCESRLRPGTMGRGETQETTMLDLQEVVSSESHEKAQDMQCGMPYCPREVQRWLEVGQRVDRLRGLGNAVVPQVAEWIGRQIIRGKEC